MLKLAIAALFATTTAAAATPYVIEMHVWGQKLDNTDYDITKDFATPTTDFQMCEMFIPVAMEYARQRLNEEPSILNYNVQATCKEAES